MVILGRNQFRTLRVGCCGLSRYDQIYPVGVYPNISDFKREAFQMINSYGISNNDGFGDCYSVEYFEGEPSQNFRRHGASIYLFILEQDNKWHFYDHDQHKFAVSNVEELKKVWGN